MAQPHTGIICGPPAWTWDNEISAQNSHSNSRQKSAQDYQETAQHAADSDPIAQALKYAQRTGASVTVTVTEETTVTETITFK